MLLSHTIEAGQQLFCLQTTACSSHDPPEVGADHFCARYPEGCPLFALWLVKLLQPKQNTQSDRRVPAPYSWHAQPWKATYKLRFVCRCAGFRPASAVQLCRINGFRKASSESQKWQGQEALTVEAQVRLSKEESAVGAQLSHQSVTSNCSWDAWLVLVHAEGAARADDWNS